MKKNTFLNIFRSYIEFHSNAKNKIDRRARSTIKSYHNKLLLISEFLSQNYSTKIKAEKLTVKIAKHYFEYLSGSYGHSYARRCVAICSAVLDYAVNEEMILFNTLSSYSIPEEPPKIPIYFTPEQIKAFEQYYSPYDEKQIACDLFVFIMHTGLDYGDLQEVTESNVFDVKGIKFLIKRRHKNNNEANIPLSSVALNILKKYEYNLHRLSNPRLNQYIKDVAADLQENTELTVKDARKIYLNDAVNNKGYSVEAASKMAGHKSTKTIQKNYVRINLNLVVSEAKRVKILQASDSLSVM